MYKMLLAKSIINYQKFSINMISMKKMQFNSVILLLIFSAACGSKKETAMRGPQAVPVSVEKVSANYAPYYDEYPSVVKALQEVELRPQVSGYITGIYFKEGDKVTKGQKLYSIDRQQTEAGYKQALAILSVQEANLVKAKQDAERYRELDKVDAIAKQQVDYAEANYKTALKQVEASKAMVQSAQTNLRYSTIVAPFDGTIGISSVRLGASVSPGQTLLNTISSDDPMGADITVDQQEIFRFYQLLEKGDDSDSSFLLTFGEQKYTHSGKMSFIDRAVDPLTGSIKIRIEFPNPDHVLRAGMSGSLRVLSNTDNKSITIPYKSITEQLGEFFVYVAEADKVTQRQVKLGKQVGANIIIKSGLKEGETIAVEGVQNLREGSLISISTPLASNKK